MKPQKTQNLQTTLQVKLAAKFMLIQNVDTTDGMTNGAICTVMYFNQRTVTPSVIWVLFDDVDIGVKCRMENHNLYTGINSEIDKYWTPIQQIERRFQVGKHKNVLVVRRQFPLTHCSATTIHKSQGSLERAVASFKGYITSHMTYVSLSRLTKLDGLYRLDFDPKTFQVDPAVNTEMQRLRQYCNH